jgi:hypothetical protein
MASVSSSSSSYSGAAAAVDHRDALLVRARDAIARLTSDLAVSSQTVAALEAENARLRDAEASARAELVSSSSSSDQARAVLEARIAALQADLRAQKASTAAALAAAEGAQKAATAYESRAGELSREAYRLEEAATSQMDEADAHRRLIGELRDRLRGALEENDEIRGQFDRLDAQASSELSAAHRASEAARKDAASAKAECTAALARVRTLEATVARMDADLDEARKAASAERSRATALESSYRQALNRWLQSVKLKFSSLPAGAGAEGALVPAPPLPPSSSSSSSSASAILLLPDGTAGGAGGAAISDDKVLAWLEQLPDVSSWFVRASQSLAAQVEARLAAGQAATEALAARLAAHSDAERRAAAQMRLLAEQRGAELDAARSECARLVADLMQARLEAAALREERDDARAHAGEMRARSEASDAEAAQQARTAADNAEAAELASAARAEIEESMRRLQAAWQERDRLLRGEIAALEAELTGAEREWAEELADTKEKLAVAMRRLRHAKEYVIPHHVRAALAAEVEKASALVRDAGATVKASRTHAERVLAHMRQSGHGLGAAQEPAWLSQTRASMAAEAAAANSLAEAADILARQLHQAVGATIADVAAGRERHGAEGASPRGLEGSPQMSSSWGDPRSEHTFGASSAVAGDAYSQAGLLRPNAIPTPVRPPTTRSLFSSTVEPPRPSSLPAPAFPQHPGATWAATAMTTPSTSASGVGASSSAPAPAPASRPRALGSGMAEFVQASLAAAEEQQRQQQQQQYQQRQQQQQQEAQLEGQLHEEDGSGGADLYAAPAPAPQPTHAVFDAQAHPLGPAQIQLDNETLARLLAQGMLALTGSTMPVPTVAAPERVAVPELVAAPAPAPASVPEPAPVPMPAPAPVPASVPTPTPTPPPVPAPQAAPTAAVAPALSLALLPAPSAPAPSAPARQPQPSSPTVPRAPAVAAPMPTFVPPPAPPAMPSSSSSSSAASSLAGRGLADAGAQVFASVEDADWRTRKARMASTHAKLEARMAALGIAGEVGTAPVVMPQHPQHRLPVSGALGGGVSFVSLAPKPVQPEA